MPILGCKTIEEAFALLQQEEQRAGRRGEFYEFIECKKWSYCMMIEIVCVILIIQSNFIRIIT